MQSEVNSYFEDGENIYVLAEFAKGCSKLSGDSSRERAHGTC